jgi:restriction system protein
MAKQQSYSQLEKQREKELKAQQREAEKRRRKEEKEAKRRHQEQQQKRVDDRNQELRGRIHALETILDVGLKKTTDFYQLIDRSLAPITIPPPPTQPIPPDRDAFQARIPKPGPIEKLTGLGKTKRLQTAATIQNQYKQAVAAFEQARQQYNQQVRAHKQAVKIHQEAKQQFYDDLVAKKAKAVTRYFEAALTQSPYPRSFPPIKVKLSYKEKTGELILEYDLPKYDAIMPTFKEYRYIKTRDEIKEKPLTKTDQENMKALYEDVIAAIALRTLHELFEADRISPWFPKFRKPLSHYANEENRIYALKQVVFNGMINTIDKSTGQDTRVCLVSVQVTREEFSKIDLSRIENTECLKHLQARISPSYQELAPVKPFVELVMTNGRFVHNVDSRINLLDLSPVEFESLIADLFSKMGLKTETTPPTRDGGVDVIAFDEDPIKGGKFVIQAKLYSNNMVNVDTVRALYGVMHDEGASKGLIVTTSRFGAASREFAADKPIELIDGENLIDLLEEYGYHAKIEMPAK